MMKRVGMKLQKMEGAEGPEKMRIHVNKAVLGSEDGCKL